MESVKAPEGEVVMAVVEGASCSVVLPPTVVFVFPELVEKLKL
jgi:hypothetical protein